MEITLTYPNALKTIKPKIDSYFEERGKHYSNLRALSDKTTNTSMEITVDTDLHMLKDLKTQEIAEIEKIIQYTNLIEKLSITLAVLDGREKSFNEKKFNDIVAEYNNFINLIDVNISTIMKLTKFMGTIDEIPSPEQPLEQVELLQKVEAANKELTTLLERNNKLSISMLEYKTAIKVIKEMCTDESA